MSLKINGWGTCCIIFGGVHGGCAIYFPGGVSYTGEILANSKPSWRCRKPCRKLKNILIHAGRLRFSNLPKIVRFGWVLVSWSGKLCLLEFICSFCKMPCLSSSVFFWQTKPDRGFREVCHDRLYRYVWLHMQTRQLLSDQPSPWSSKYLDWKGDWIDDAFKVWRTSLPKFNMEPKDDGVHKESPLPGCHFQVPS